MRESSLMWRMILWKTSAGSFLNSRSACRASRISYIRGVLVEEVVEPPELERFFA